MLKLFLFRFWPVLIPLLVYAWWFRRARRKASIDGKPTLLFRDTPWYWALLSSLVLAIICFMVMSLERTEQKGNYIPPHLENGMVVPGGVAK